jgi:hypothetical protein
MLKFSLFFRSVPLATVVALALTPLFPLAASAQDVPSYAQPTVVNADETIHGRIRSVDGAFNISVDDDRGFVDSVVLHQGTIINPTGLTLSPGMSVTILGANAGSALSANEIDTPYSYSGPVPTPVYYGPGYWAPGFAYGYGPSFSLALIIGGGGGGWSYVHQPFYGRPWNGHAYFGAAVGYAGPRGRIEATHAYSGPGARYPTGGHAPGVAHAPAAFAGRSFAGEARANAYHSEAGQARSYSHATAASRGGGSSHAQAAAHGGGGHDH